uniref:Uncharacterized protein n=1 Tax=Chromera velia CCMP2878 TaxID=1169474 RepID=A0A0G4HAI3_9ALVE|eukprot:Cvel_25666.t1-p1 / transcript=Cvel_25666.t1 / gene=Cvel_25666 / organism=Chromera_velia_CCMP2878 / gene_product=Stress-induced-phosphoprotein 1, putative / transcript_product=Stress-induced-phosphoprotein 1, putative / location=Cvel_scaffold2940:17748-20137(+) / protein_length=566 / sequence_SO=supercontig / SO=protein_coding / is_pseudo=false
MQEEISPAVRAAALKEEGNKFLSDGKTEKAIEAYTEAIALEPSNHIFWSNRSAAYLKINNGEESLRDAEECIRVSPPEFCKGYSRKATALMLLNRPAEALETCQIGLKADPGNKVLQETLKSSKKSYVNQHLTKTPWIGTVSEALGGYEQSFQFQPEGGVCIQILGNKMDGRYNINIDHKPFWLDVYLPDCPTGVPHVFKFDVDLLSDLQKEIDRREGVRAESKKKKKKKGKKANKEKEEQGQQVAGAGNEETDSAAAATSAAGGDEDTSPSAPSPASSSSPSPSSSSTASADPGWHLSEPTSLTLVCPYMSVERPRKFEGEGMVEMKAISAGEADALMAGTQRKVDAKILALPFDDQVKSFCEEMVSLLPEHMQGPSPTDSAEEGSAKMAAALRLQSNMMKLDNRYPEPVSLAVQLYVEGQQEPPPAVKQSIETLKKKMDALGLKKNEEEGIGSASSASRLKEEKERLEAKRKEASATLSSHDDEEGRSKSTEAPSNLDDPEGRSVGGGGKLSGRQKAAIVLTAMAVVGGGVALFLYLTRKPSSSSSGREGGGGASSSLRGGGGS